MIFKFGYFSLLACATTVLMVGCRDAPSPPKQAKRAVVDEPELSNEQLRIRGITDSETVIQGLSGKKSILTTALKDAQVDLAAVVSGKIKYVGIADQTIDSLLSSADGNSQGSLATFMYWPINPEVELIEFTEVWAPMLKNGRFDDTQLGVLKGSFNESGVFEMETKFEGRMLRNGEPLGVRAYQTLGWQEVAENDWKLVSWKQKKFTVINSPGNLFEEVTADLIPDVETLNAVSTATHEDLIITRCGEMEIVRSLENGKMVEAQAIKEAKDEFKGCNDWGSVGQYPSVSVVDFDNDGYEDLFMTDRWQSVQLLRNQGDETFVDVTKSVGIDVPEMATCGYFFDFDNDGDSDLLIGMSMVPSQFFENVGGKFKPHEAINEVLRETRFVNAISVADLNRDGLEDLYLSTYATGTGPIDDWIGFVTREKEQLKTRLKILGNDKFVDRGGPPNILLMNRGESFEWVKMDDGLKQYRNSYQTSWNDYDTDGDLDLYICNDFAPDVFLRNDTERGSYKPVFTDVTSTVIPTMDMGFGMGCSWGDYDNDGDLDLYVSNMYSKAGNRIVDQVKDADPRLKVAAHGNFLFENQEGVFKQVAGDEEGEQHVARVGWSYGGQFADFDNDGNLDIYVPSGCYSAPEEVKTKIDL
eukprot:COSAG04_NODE_1016_length_8749_cov_3.658613_1_plen_643_part_00